MQFWCETNGLSTAELPTLAGLLEDAGFTGLVASTPSIEQDDAPESDAWATISAMLASTNTLRFLTCVSLADRHLLADVTQHLRRLPPGARARLALTVGVGWMAEEFEDCGIVDNAGPRVNDMLKALRAEWTDHQVKRPIPLWGSGASSIALQRAALHCDGWVSDPISACRAMRLAEELHRHRRQAAMPGQRFEITVCLDREPTVELCRRAQDRGITGIKWSPPTDHQRRAIEDFARSVIARCS